MTRFLLHDRTKNSCFSALWCLPKSTLVVKRIKFLETSQNCAQFLRQANNRNSKKFPYFVVKQIDSTSLEMPNLVWKAPVSSMTTSNSVIPKVPSFTRK